MKKVLVTGGAGFIGSHVVRLFVNKYSDYEIYNLDNLTYAGNLENLKDIEGKPNYKFIKGDITDQAFIDALFDEHKFGAVIHLAAESHVDRSISNPLDFVITNVIGTVNLLNAAKRTWECSKDKPVREDRLFYHVSTDEVYGSLGDTGFFLETTPTILNRLTQPLKQVPTILCVLISILIIYQLLFPTAQITMVRINFLKN